VGPHNDDAFEVDTEPEDPQAEDPLDDYPYCYFPDGEPVFDSRPPGLRFHLLHVVGMAVVAGLIFAAFYSSNVGRQPKADPSSAREPLARSLADQASAAQYRLAATGSDAAAAARAAQYLQRMSAACQDTDTALVQLQTILSEYTATPEIRKDADWRNRVAIPLVTVDSAGAKLISLSDPPDALGPLNASLHKAGRELRESVHDFALTVETGDSQYLTQAEVHQMNCKRMSEEATDAFAQYRKQMGDAAAVTGP